MILKIAGGVFIGIMAVLLVRAAPGWYAEQQELAASMKLSSLVPDRVIQNCGTPLKDTVEQLVPASDSSSGVVTRELSYRTSDDIYTWSIHFIAPVGEPYHFSHISDPRDPKTSEQKLRWLPCLNK